MNTPVYIITGFLESGKTKFISEMLADEGFSEGERTLLLCCEEGEEEYDSKLLHRTNTVLEPLDEPEDLEKLVELDEKYRPERVIIEYNSTWLLQALYSARSPRAGIWRRSSRWWIPPPSRSISRTCARSWPTA